MMENYERLYQCTKCDIIDAAILPCDHTYCKKCLIESLKEYSLTNKAAGFICPMCKDPIFMEFIRRFYMPDEEAIELFEVLGSCIKCKQQNNNIFELLCGHIVCEICFALQLESVIKENMSFLSITCWKCQVFIPPKYYKKLVSEELSEKLKKDVRDYPMCKCRKCNKVNKSSKNNFKCCNTCYSCGLEKACKCIAFIHIKKDKLLDKKVKNVNLLEPLQKLNNQLCKICKAVPGTVLPCTDYICADCLRSEIIKQMKINPFDSLRKCICGEVIPLNQVVESFGSKVAYDRALTVIGEEWAFSPKFECEICLGKFEVEGSITLECDHRFCHPCMKNYFTELITTSNVSETQLVCPKCSKAVTHNIVQGVVSDELYKKYIEFSFRNWKPEEGWILKYCAFCEGAAEIDERQKRFKCPKCKKEYCPQCNNDHKESVSCEEWREMLENNKANEEKKQNRGNKNIEIAPRNRAQTPNIANANLGPDKIKSGANKNNANGKQNAKPAEEIKKKQASQSKAKAIAELNQKKEMEENQKKDMEYIKKNCKQCPKCKVSAEKESGCNFMKCRWPTCHDTYFCFICGSVLTRNHHYSHYKLTGPFGNSCNKIDGIKDI